MKLRKSLIEKELEKDNWDKQNAGSRNYDEHLQKKVNFKKPGIFATVIILILMLLVVVLFVLKVVFNNRPESESDSTSSVSSEETTPASATEIETFLSTNLVIGSNTRTDVESLVSISSSGTNYIIDKSISIYKNLNFKTVYVFDSNDILCSILKISSLDNLQRSSLCIVFQELASDINSIYPQMSITKEWLGNAKEYNVDVWNAAILNNELNLTAEYAENGMHIVLEVSGTPSEDYIKQSSFGAIIFRLDKAA